MAPRATVDDRCAGVSPRDNAMAVGQRLFTRVRTGQGIRAPGVSLLFHACEIFDGIAEWLLTPQLKCLNTEGIHRPNFEGIEAVNPERLR